MYNKDLKLSKITNLSIIVICYKLIVASNNLICNHDNLAVEQSKICVKGSLKPKFKHVASWNKNETEKDKKLNELPKPVAMTSQPFTLSTSPVCPPKHAVIQDCGGGLGG